MTSLHPSSSLHQPPVLPTKTPVELEAPLGRDLGHDSDLNRAAVAIFGVAGVAVIAVTAAWLMLRGDGPVAVRAAEPLLGRGFERAQGFERENAAVAADAPMLRPGLPTDDGPGPGAFTLMDAATGLREVVEMAPPGAASTLAR